MNMELKFVWKILVTSGVKNERVSARDGQGKGGRETALNSSTDVGPCTSNTSASEHFPRSEMHSPTHSSTACVQINPDNDFLMHLTI